MAKAPDKNPALAPLHANRVGAIWRKYSSHTASQGRAIRAIRDYKVLLVLKDLEG